MSLLTLQSDFRAWLTTGSDAVAARFAPEAQAGLLVYQNNYRASLMACLEESFPQTLAWIGEEAFRSVAATLVDGRPPDSWSLDHYAAHFPPALGQALPDDPEIAELAALEQALTDAFIGPDAAVLAPHQLADIDWETAVLRLVPTARLLTLTTNAAAIWSALSSGMEPPSAEILTEPVTLLVWRAGHISCFRSLDRVEGEVMRDMISGITFPDVCSRMVAALGEQDGIMMAGALLAQWAAEGLLMKIA
jgi:Putative DNA-binding domain